MKYHKILNIDMSVCTAEQKIAYNLAFANYDWIKKQYDKASTEICRSELISEAISKLLENYKRGWGYVEGKYNEDAIFCALNAGFRKYMLGDEHIANSYEQIGKWFPANYLKCQERGIK